MKRFLVFCYNQWYPSGGWSEFVGSFGSLDEAKDVSKKKGSDHREVVDGETENIVWEEHVTRRQGGEIVS